MGYDTFEFGNKKQNMPKHVEGAFFHGKEAYLTMLFQHRKKKYFTTNIRGEK